MTSTKGPRQKNWRVLSAEERQEEILLCALADRDGMPLAKLGGSVTQQGIDDAQKNGLAVIENGRLAPTDAGLWDTVGLLAQLHNA